MFNPTAKDHHGVAVDSRGNVFTSSYNAPNGSVTFRKYSPAGERVNFVSSGDVVIPPVPGPGRDGFEGL